MSSPIKINGINETKKSMKRGKCNSTTYLININKNKTCLQLGPFADIKRPIPALDRGELLKHPAHGSKFLILPPSANNLNAESESTFPAHAGGIRLPVFAFRAHTRNGHRQNWIARHRKWCDICDVRTPIR